MHCSWLKRLTSLQNLEWDDKLPEKLVALMTELNKKLCHGDPVQGMWNVPKEPTHVCVWCDASNLAYGAALEVDGIVVEDCSWLRQASD